MVPRRGRPCPEAKCSKGFKVDGVAECAGMWPSGTPSENDRWISHGQPQPSEATDDLAEAASVGGRRAHAVGVGSGDKAGTTGPLGEGACL